MQSSNAQKAATRLRAPIGQFGAGNTEPAQLMMDDWRVARPGRTH
jgi:hypothetical protein